MVNILGESSLKIEQLNLSNRTYDCLKSNNINTIMDLMFVSEEELIRLRNLGEKSLKEINNIKYELLNGSFVFNKSKQERINISESKSLLTSSIIECISNDKLKIKRIMFYDEYGSLHHDLKVNKLKISARGINALLNNGYTYVSELISFKNMGNKTANEIVKKIYDIVYIIYDNEEWLLESANKDDFLYYGKYTNEIIKGYSEYLILFDVIKAKDNICTFFRENENLLESNVNVVSISEEFMKNPELLKLFYKNLFFKGIIKDHIYTLFSSQKRILSLYNIRQNLPQHLRGTLIEKTIIDELIEEKKLEKVDGNFRCWYPTILEYIDSIKTDRDGYILLQRLQGNTLGEIGCYLDITRERVRQIEKKVLNNIPCVKEERYKQIFQKYDWDLETFVKVYDESEVTFAYLSMVYTKGTDKLELFLNNQDIPYDIRIKAEKIIYKDYTTIGSSKIKKDRCEILDYVLRTYCRNEVTVKEVYNLYYQLLKNLDLFDNEDMIYPERYFETKLANSKKVLWKFKKKLRYYDFESISIDEIIEGLNLHQYKDIEYSTLKFFNDYLDLMQEWDIRDEYELHNLIKKKIINETSVEIKLLRMPNIKFGRANRDMQVLDLLIQNAPIENDKLAKMYEDEYGVKAETALANYFKCIDEYCHNSIYSIDSKPLIKDEFSLMKNALNKEFYLISDVKAIFKKKFPHGDITLINPYNLKCLGFKVNSNDIYSDKYTSCEQYFRTLILKDDIFDANTIGIAIYSNQTYYHVVKMLREEFDILEFSYNKFVNIRRLEQIGVNKSYLKEFCDAVYMFQNEEFFTIEFLRKHGFEHKLYELGFNDCFYSSLLKYDLRFKYRRLEGTILFRRSKETVTLNNLIEYLVYKFRSIDIYDFMEFVFKEYGIKIDLYKLQTSAKEVGMYYDSIMEKIYIDYDEYFKEV